MSSIALPTVVRRPRAFVGVRGPEAADFLERMVSNEVATLAVGDAREALLLTPKSRVIATLVVVRRADDDFLLVTDPDVSQVVADTLLRARFAARVEIGLESHPSHVTLHDQTVPDGLSFRTDDFGVPAVERIGEDAPADAPVLAPLDAEVLRIEAGTPAMGAELDDRVLPAEAGLVERAVSFTKGCYPGQEPVARLHHRGHANRSLRVLAIAGTEPPPRDAEVLADDRVVGRVTSAVARRDDVVALAYIRVEVADDAELVVNGASARLIERRRP